MDFKENVKTSVLKSDEIYHINFVNYNNDLYTYDKFEPYTFEDCKSFEDTYRELVKAGAKEKDLVHQLNTRSVNYGLRPNEQSLINTINELKEQQNLEEQIISELNSFANDFNVSKTNEQFNEQVNEQGENNNVK